MMDELTMQVSPIVVKDGKKVAYVTFSDDKRTAEGIIPDCCLLSCKGFNDNEALALENYMRRELTNLKRMAAGNNVLKAMMK